MLRCLNSKGERFKVRVDRGLKKLALTLNGFLKWRELISKRQNSHSSNSGP